MRRLVDRNPPAEEEEIDLTPKGIIDRFDLFNYTKYSENCVYGHFGNKDVPWERIGW